MVNHYTLAKGNFNCTLYDELNDEVKTLFKQYYQTNLEYLCLFTHIAHELAKIWHGTTKTWNIYDVYVIAVTSRAFTMKGLAFSVAAQATAKRPWFVNQTLFYGWRIYSVRILEATLSSGIVWNESYMHFFKAIRTTP